MDFDATKYGFADNNEFHKLVAAVDLSTPQKIASFKEWQNRGGTKQELLELDDSIVCGYIILFDTPDKNGTIITKESVNTEFFDLLKSAGKIIDYSVDETGVKILTKAVNIRTISNTD